MKKCIIIILLCCVFISGCFATSSKVTQRLSLGMTTSEVATLIGYPFSKNAYTNSRNNSIEEWEYKETTWDDGGWSWDKTQISSILFFENGKLKAFNKSNERYKTKNPFRPSYNLDITTHNE